MHPAQPLWPYGPGLDFGRCRKCNRRCVLPFLFSDARPDRRGAGYSTRLPPLTMAAAPWRPVGNSDWTVQYSYVAAQPEASSHSRFLPGHRAQPLTILFVRLLDALEQPAVVSATHHLWRHPNAGMFVSSVIVMFFAVLGTRVGFAMPLDVTANWIFRVTPIGGATECSAGQPACAARTGCSTGLGRIGRGSSLAVAWRQAAGHLAVLAILGIVAAEVTLAGFRKVPFTCSYLPGKSNLHLTFSGFALRALAFSWIKGRYLNYTRCGTQRAMH